MILNKKVNLKDGSEDRAFDRGEKKKYGYCLISSYKSFSSYRFFFDLKTKKIPNKFLLVSFFFFLAFLFFKAYGLDVSFQKSFFLQRGLGFVVAFLCTFPLYMIKGLGAGDVKFFSVFGLLHKGGLVLETFLYSLCWAFVFGFFMLTFQGKLKEFFRNLVSFEFYFKPDKAHRMPFSFPFFMGFLSYCVLNIV